MNPRKNRKKHKLLLIESQDAEVRARIEAAERKAVQHLADYRAAANGLLRDLKERGYAVETVGALEVKEVDASLAHLLSEWFPKIGNTSVRQDIVSAIAGMKGRQGVGVLVGFYRDVASASVIDDALLWSLADAIERHSGPENYDDVRELIGLDSGESRGLLALALARTKNPEAVGILDDLLDDPIVSGHALMALRRLGARIEASRVEPFLRHDAGWVRREAQKLLRQTRN